VKRDPYYPSYNARPSASTSTIADITASRVSKDAVRKMRIFQEDSYISLDFMNQEAARFKKTDSSLVREKIKIKKGQPLKRELESFIECVRTLKRPIVSGVEGRRALQVAFEILKKINPSKYQ